MPSTSQLTALLHAISGRPEAALAALSGLAGLDGHQKFHLGEPFATAGGDPRRWRRQRSN